MTNDLVKIEKSLDLEKLDAVDFIPSEIIRLCSPIANNFTALQYRSLNELNTKKRNTKVIIALTQDDGNDYKNINYLDQMVLNAVCTLCFAHTYVFTTRQIYQALAGRDTKIPLKKDGGGGEYRQMIDIITKSMEKLNATKIFISKMIPKSVETSPSILNDADTLKYRILDYMEASTIRGGKELIAYELIATPYLLKQAIDNKQIYTVSGEIYKLPISTTWQSCLIRDYLISRIEALKNKNNYQYQQNILCQNIYNTVDIDGYLDHLASDNTRAVTKKRLRETAKKILKNWITIGYIKNFAEYKDGKSIAGYTIYFNDNTQALINSKKERRQTKKMRG